MWGKPIMGQEKSASFNQVESLIDDGNSLIVVSG